MENLLRNPKPRDLIEALSAAEKGWFATCVESNRDERTGLISIAPKKLTIPQPTYIGKGTRDDLFLAAEIMDRTIKLISEKELPEFITKFIYEIDPKGDYPINNPYQKCFEHNQDPFGGPSRKSPQREFKISGPMY